MAQQAKETCQLLVDEKLESKRKELDVGASASFINMQSSDVLMGVGVLGDEKSSLENVKDVLGGGGHRVSSCASGSRLDLVKKDVCGLRVMSVANAIRCD